MKAVYKKRPKRRNLLILAMLDIMSNTMAGIAVLFFLQVALQKQEPPPVPVRGRQVFIVHLKPAVVGDQLASIFLKHEYNGKEIVYFDDQIDSYRTSFPYTDAPNAQIGFDRMVFRSKKRPNKIEVHLLDPMEGTYTLGVIYTDHDRFYERKILHRLIIDSYFELPEGGTKYQSRKVTRELDSPTNYYQYQVKIHPDLSASLDF